MQDGRPDGVKPIYPPQQLRCAGIIRELKSNTNRSLHPIQILSPGDPAVLLQSPPFPSPYRHPARRWRCWDVLWWRSAAWKPQSAAHCPSAPVEVSWPPVGWNPGRCHELQVDLPTVLNSLSPERFEWNFMYRQTSNIRRTREGNNMVDHSDVVGASPVGAAPTTSSFST